MVPSVAVSWGLLAYLGRGLRGAVSLELVSNGFEWCLLTGTLSRRCHIFGIADQDVV